jgi:hypothetical protein
VSSPRTYTGWSPEKVGSFFGMTGRQVTVVMVAILPPLTAVGRSHWGTAAKLLPITLAVVALIVVPIRRRKAYRWLADFTSFQIGRAMGWSMWRSNAASGAASSEELARVDLPGVLASLRTYDGPPFGPQQRRVCVIHQPHEGLWLATARCTHPGIGGADEMMRDGYAAGLGGMLAAAAESEDVVRLSTLIRTVPDDGAERAAWVADNEMADLPDVVRIASAEIEASTINASVRHELFVSVGISEQRIHKSAGEAGGGVDGRARVLYRHLGEVEAQLRGLGVTQVDWLTSQGLAGAIRTGFNPAEAAGMEAARQEQARGRSTVTGVPMGAAGPAKAPAPSPRRYVHDAFTTVSYAVMLPKRPTRVGSLSRILTPSVPGERRTLALHYEPFAPGKADKQMDHDIWGAEMAEDLKTTRGFRLTRREKRRSADAARRDQQMMMGHTLVRVAGAAAVTVPSGHGIEDAASRFEASARAAGFQLLRLDLAQDSGFAAAVLPVGVGLPSRGWRK